MNELIIKIFSSKEDFKVMAESFDKLVSNFGGKLMSAKKEKDYQNQIFQIGENPNQIEIIVKNKSPKI